MHVSSDVEILEASPAPSGLPAEALCLHATLAIVER